MTLETRTGHVVGCIVATIAGGAGTVHIVDGRGMLPEGGTTDLMIRVVDALPPATPTIDLRTGCFTLEVR